MLIIETLLHVIVTVGALMVALPYALLSHQAAPAWPARSAPSAAGFALLLSGAALGLWCIAQFIVIGRGTPNPLDPPKFLVRKGPYRLVRNPIYVAGGLILVGEALIFGSLALLIYSGLVMVSFHLFVVLYEEPQLQRRFGDSYDEYLRRVPRWFPAISNAPPPRRPRAKNWPEKS